MRIAGFDLGRRRIGVAVSDPSGTLATPWGFVDGRGSDKEVAERLFVLLRALGREESGLVGIVLGLPWHLDGRSHKDGLRVKILAEDLERRTGLPVSLQDERLTSVEAEQRLAERVGDWRKRKDRLDAAAAAIILQDYLDSGVQRGSCVKAGFGKA
ncbi:MAG: Holliday junction resolvase RuvX [Acidobacteria bacterium]|nr:Holliday junction resolvase RuvX [Acidobacteriota bacterium]|tara:strand:+ start:3115 stop:3582 length:468 start_codon:yes stop_codon:yes gene_type:complete